MLQATGESISQIHKNDDERNELSETMADKRQLIVDRETSSVTEVKASESIN